jgi:hypothetical protein
MLIDFALAFVSALHINRAAAANARLGGGVMYRLSFLFTAMLAVFAGSFLGDITSWGELTRLTDRSIAWTLANALDQSFYSGTSDAGFFLFIMMAIVLVAPRALRREPGSMAAQLARLLVASLVVLFLLELAGSAIMWTIYFTGGSLGPWNIEWLPNSSRQIWVGAPSGVQGILILLVGTAAIAVPRWLGIFKPKASRTDVHVSWYTSA